MAERPTHVPKFGNWDPNEHVPYTVVFDHARAGKQRRSSKDESDFRLGMEEGGREPHARHRRQPSRGDGDSEHVQSASVDVVSREFVPRRGTSGGGYQENGTSEHTAERVYRNVGPGLSPMHPQAYPGRLGKKLGSVSPAVDRKSEAGTLTPGTPGRNWPERGAVPLPKFGDWDVNNPASGEGFTVIFNKARDEKKTGGALRIPSTQTDTPLRPEADIHKAPAATQQTSNWCCWCFHPSAVN